MVFEFHWFNKYTNMLLLFSSVLSVSNVDNSYGNLRNVSCCLRLRFGSCFFTALFWSLL